MIKISNNICILEVALIRLLPISWIVEEWVKLTECQCGNKPICTYNEVLTNCKWQLWAWTRKCTIVMSKQKMVEDICPHLCISCVSPLRHVYQILRNPNYEHNENFLERFADTKVQLWTFCLKEDWCYVFVSTKTYQIELDKTKVIWIKSKSFFKKWTI